MSHPHATIHEIVRALVLAGCSLGCAACGAWSQSLPDGDGRTARQTSDVTVQAAFSPADERAIRIIDSAYVAAWLHDDTAGVLATLAEDVVLMPAGQDPLRGITAVRAFWWPADGSHLKVLRFSRGIDEVAGTGDIAYVRGTSSLLFVTNRRGSRTLRRSRVMTLTVFLRQRTGAWRIGRMMWARTGQES